ncbi:hypothetical protein B0T14DRAFT_563634 [Immersiella caudata]|uniref:F-box domain-containing protein n=1 Tax=Immersiella caudata TaxID=314043 RepID=A0AA39X623_9PEZI|nr:hypothetical protein B0T14DRAFT_563634 [Immersiella caudata]
MGLDSLPVELLHSIMSLLDPKELHPLRLTCSRLSVVATSHTMKTLAFCLCKGDFDNLQRIANRPDHAEHVTSLLYYAEMLSSKRHDFEAYAREVNYYQFADAELRDHFATYERLFESQQEMLSQNTDSKVLEQLIPRLPNLEDITVTSQPGWPGTWEPEEETYERDGWPFRDDWPFRRNKIEYTGVISGCGVKQSDGPSRHIRALLRGIHKARTKLRTLRARGMQYSFFNPNQFGLPQVAHLLENLTCFELSVDALAPWDYTSEQYDTERYGMDDRHTLAAHVTDGSVCRTTMKQGVLRTALLSMPNLTMLRLIIFGCIPNYKLTNGTCNPPSLEDMIDTEQVWPKLQFLTLEGMYAVQEQLVGIVLAAKTSLMKLELNGVRLLNGSWEMLLPLLKEGLVGRRVDVSLQGDVLLQDWPDDTGVGWPKEWRIVGGGGRYGAAVRNYFNDPAFSKVPLESGLGASFEDFGMSDSEESSEDDLGDGIDWT